MKSEIWKNKFIDTAIQYIYLQKRKKKKKWYKKEKKTKNKIL